MEKNKKILIVDDEPDILKMTEFRMRKAGYITVTAVDGQEGLDKAREENPDLILLDYRLPLMNGSEVYMKLKASEALRDIPVLFLTASRENENIKNILDECGARHIMIKPYDPQALLDKVRELLVEKRL